MRLLHEACQRGVAAVVVTHDAQLAAWADRRASPPRRAGGRPDRPAARPRIPPHAWGDPVSIPLRDPPDLAGDAGGIVARRAVVRWGWRLFRREWRPAAARARPAHRGGRGDDLGHQRRHERSAPQPELRHVRHRCRAGHAARHRTRTWPPTSPPFRAAGVRPISSRIRTSLPAPPSPCNCARRVRTGTTTAPAAQPGQRHLPGRPRPGGADQPGREPVRRARRRYLAGGRHDLAGDRHRAGPEQPGGRVRAGRTGPGPAPGPGAHAARPGRGAAGDQRWPRDGARCPRGDGNSPLRQRGQVLAGDGRPARGGTRPGVHRPGVGSQLLGDGPAQAPCPRHARCDRRDRAPPPPGHGRGRPGRRRDRRAGRGGARVRRLARLRADAAAGCWPRGRQRRTCHGGRSPSGSCSRSRRRCWRPAARPRR